MVILLQNGSRQSNCGTDYINNYHYNNINYNHDCSGSKESGLENVDTNGISTFHGPVKAVPRWWYGMVK